MNVAIIGAGGIAQTHRAGYEKAGAHLLGFVEPNPMQRSQRESEWQVKGFENLAALLEQHSPQAVSVCTPNAFHLPLTLEAIAAGIHVLCEKPLSLSLAECNTMIDAAKQAKVVLQTGHHLRSNWYVAHAKRLIDSGELGRITFVRLRQSHDWGGAGRVPETFSSLARAGGGTLLDNGCHLMDLVRHLAGNVKSVYAKIATLAYPIEVEDVSLAHLELESGAFASIENSWSSIGFEEGFWVYGTRGTLECHFASGQPRSLLHHHRYSQPTDWGVRDTTTYKVGNEGGHTAQIKGFLEAIRQQTTPVCTGEDGRESVRLVLAAYESAKSGQAVLL